MTIAPENARAVGFSDDGLCLEIRDTKWLSAEVLHKYFKHKNVSSFIRQLNNYGFKTIPLVMNSTLAHCFAHDCFRKGRVDLLEGVVRRGGPIANENNKVSEALHLMKEKESAAEERILKLKRTNDELRKQNEELLEENKRLKANWNVVQDTLRAQALDQQRRSSCNPVLENPATVQSQDNYSDIFLLAGFPPLFPEDF